MRENIVKTKSFAFAIRIVKLYQFLCDEKKEYTLSKQLLSSGTSVGAMVREAEHAESKADFKHKMAIAQKEINETIYWLELLKETNYLATDQFESIHSDAIEIIRLVLRCINSDRYKLVLFPLLFVNKIFTTLWRSSSFLALIRRKITLLLTTVIYESNH